MWSTAMRPFSLPGLRATIPRKTRDAWLGCSTRSRPPIWSRMATTDADERGGSNLYTNCVIALDVKTGKLKWYYQFTPHDLHDWDATEPRLLVDTDYGACPPQRLV